MEDTEHLSGGTAPLGNQTGLSSYASWIMNIDEDLFKASKQLEQSSKSKLAMAPSPQPIFTEDLSGGIEDEDLLNIELK